MSLHPKRVIFGLVAGTAKALASPVRVEILDLLAQGARPVESVAAATGISIANASHHLLELKRAGLLTASRSGRLMVYSISDEAVVELLRTVSIFTEVHSAETAQALNELYRRRDPIDPVSREELLNYLKSGSGIAIDVRPELEFRAAHIPGAISVPVEILQDRVNELPTDRQIVTYCRGPYCVYSYEAMEVLRPAGLRARRLQGGFLEWRRHGMPIESGSPSV